MAIYYVTGQTTGTIAETDPIAQIWNPAAGRRIRIVEATMGVFGDFTSVVQRLYLQRSTARGATPNNTVTPDADNSGEGDAAPDSAAVLEMGPFGTAPTLATPELYCPLIDGAEAQAKQPYFLLPIPRGLSVPPGSGLCIMHSTLSGNTWTNLLAGFVFED